MNIIDVKHFSKEILIGKLRNLTMLKDLYNYIYKDVYISLEKVNTKSLVPPQNYVLNYELAQKRELRFALLEKGYDLFNLNGYLELTVENESGHGSQVVTLLPPVVEESIENDGMIVPIINDGMHRIYLARIERINPEVIYVRGIPKEFPYYAYPVCNGWDDVERIYEIAKGYTKKWHRIKDNKKLYRNFDSVFTNCSKPRETK